MKIRYKVGIIGYGKMGEIRHRAIDEIGTAEVIAISDSLELDSSLPNLSHDEIINHSDLDIIVICTPNYLNKKLTIEALRAGKHVFCEKPPAFTRSEMQEILKTSCRA